MAVNRIRAIFITSIHTRLRDNKSCFTTVTRWSNNQRVNSNSPQYPKHLHTTEQSQLVCLDLPRQDGGQWTAPAEHSSETLLPACFCGLLCAFLNEPFKDKSIWSNWTLLIGITCTGPVHHVHTCHTWDFNYRTWLHRAVHLCGSICIQYVPPLVYSSLCQLVGANRKPVSDDIFFLKQTTQSSCSIIKTADNSFNKRLLFD